MPEIDVIVLGAGAAGLMCALTAAQRGRRVLVLEKSNKVGKKILMFSKVFDLEILPAFVFEVMVYLADTLRGFGHALVVTRVEDVEVLRVQECLDDILIIL